MHVYIDEANAEKVTEIRPKTEKISIWVERALRGRHFQAIRVMRLCEGIYIVE